MFKDCWNDPDYNIWIDKLKKYPPLRETEHGRELYRLINRIDDSDSTLLDLGCGSAEISSWVKAQYTGADLPNVIRNISKKFNPELDYIYIDITNHKGKLLKGFDIIVMNAFIDVMEDPLKILDKVLSSAKKYVILHRQHFTGNKTYVEKRKSYGKETFHSIINIDDFIRLLVKHHCIVLDVIDLDLIENETWQSYLIKKT
jgi:trans-aconitate methyltransferase